MYKIEIEITASGAAFYGEKGEIDPAEFSRILRDIASRIENGGELFGIPLGNFYRFGVKELNGNTCGSVTLSYWKD